MAAFYSSRTAASSASLARKRALRRAKALGVTIVQGLSGGWHELTVEAPKHHRFAMADTHEIVVANAGSVTDGLWESMATDLESDTIVPCTETDCEWCEDSGDSQ